jgi:hypothetical protein
MKVHEFTEKKGKSTSKNVYVKQQVIEKPRRAILPPLTGPRVVSPRKKLF